MPVAGVSRYIIYRCPTAEGNYLEIGEANKTTFYDRDIVTGRAYYYKVAGSSNSQAVTPKSAYIKAIVSSPTPVPTAKPTLSPTPTPTPKPSATPMPTHTPEPISHITPEEIAEYHTLKVGMNDPDVARLKRRMYELGYFTNKTENNRFTETTAEYVKEFQRVNGLKADGVATPEMQALFYSQYAIPKPAPSPSAKPTPKPQSPKNIKVTSTAKSITLTWSPVVGATSYKVYRSTKSNGVYSLKKEVQTTTCIDNSYLLSNSTYYYRIESVFADGAISDKSNYVKAVTAKPTPTPYVEPEYPLEDVGTGYSGTSYGTRWFKNTYKNTSKISTIDGYTIAYYAEDIYENRLEAFGYGDSVLYETINQTIRPGRTGTTPKIAAYGFDGAKRIYVAVVMMHLTDGRTISIPEHLQQYWYWEY